MRLLTFAAATALLASSLAVAQGPEPGSLPEQIAPDLPVHGPVPVRPATIFGRGNPFLLNSFPKQFML